MSPTSVFRRGFARAVQRGDPRLGFFVGLGATLLVALAFGTLDLPERLELTLLDNLGFRRRAPVPESPRLAVIDIDDAAAQKLPWPMPRRHHGEVVLMLDRLGARQIAFDVEFKMIVPREGHYDPESGEHLLDASNRFFRTAIARSGKVTLGYHIEIQDRLQALRPWAGALKAAFAQRIGAGPVEVSRETGVPQELLAGQFEAVREEFVSRAVAERLRQNPDLTFSQAKALFLPGAGRDHPDLHLLHYGYWLARARELVERKGARIKVEGLPSRVRECSWLVPPSWPFLQAAAGVGCTNAEPDSIDGILRRPWAAMLHEGAPHAYLGVAAAARELEAELAVRADALVVKAGTPPRSFQIDEEGRLLLNWAGNSARRREATFVHVPFISLVDCYEKRFEVLDRNVRTTIAQLEERKPHHDEYVALSDRLRPVLAGQVDMAPEAMRAVEGRLEELRLRFLEDIEGELRELDRGIKALDPSKQRTRENLMKQKAKLEIQAAPLRIADAQEAALRPLVEGRICFVGSAHTASGDLLPSPLNTRTPGVDAPVNAANMMLTGVALRRVPAWVNLAYLLALGVLVSAAVGHWSTTWSALFTAGVVAAVLAVYAWLFSAMGLLVAGAGPAASAVAAFASVTAFKELVTQRSKRKLQRELEKNTSPELVKILMEHPEFLSRPRKMEGTFFFSDVKSFTSISEKMTADVLFPFINRYLDRMTRVLKHRQAYLDKYIGDGIMALFGVPVRSTRHAEDACRAALECQAALAGLNAEFAAGGQPQLKSRIGLHSGEVSAGYVGGTERSDYTVLGDAVNLAARLEGANKEYGTSIMISESTRQLVGSAFVVRELDLIRVVGKRVPTVIYELVCAAGEPSPLPEGFLAAYEAALAAYKARRWEEGEEAFAQALRLKPGDLPSEYYRDRCKTFRHAPPPEDWEGVYELTSK